MQHVYTLQVLTDLNALAKVVQWFNCIESQVKHIQASPLFWMQLHTVLMEGVTNAIRHAHRDKPTTTPIDIEVKLLEHHLELRIWDHGTPFDLVQKLSQIPEMVDPMQSGGRGLRLIEKMSDQFSYTRTHDDRNCLLIVKFHDETQPLAEPMAK